MSIFNSVSYKKPKRSKFDLSFENKLSFNAGELLPVCTYDVMPGDDFSISVNSLIRMQATLAPVMHRVNVRFDAFFVPSRLCCSLFDQGFITGGRVGDVDIQLPFFYTSDLTHHPEEWPVLLDYIYGISTFDFSESTNLVDYKVSAMPLIAYQLIWDSYYRDQNLQKSLFNNGIDGETIEDPYDTSLFGSVHAWFNVLSPLRKVSWKKDYFTSALPFTQRGTAPVLDFESAMSFNPEGTTYIRRENGSVIGLVTDQHVYLHPDVSGILRANIERGAAAISSDSSNSQIFDAAIQSGVFSTEMWNNLVMDGFIPSALANSGIKATIDNSSNLKVTNSAPITINELSYMQRMQMWLEKNARAGSRYIEQLRSHWGVISDDARLQRPEFLGRYTSPIVMTEIEQTSQSDNTSLGYLGGRGTSYGNNQNFHYYAKEHGYIMVLMSVLPRGEYMRALNPIANKINRFDFAFPEFANLGEQAVLYKELDYSHPDATSVFGYQSRYADYKFKLDEIHGDFRSNLAFWHMARNPINAKLNSEFVTANPTDRVFAPSDNVTNQHYLAQILFNTRAIRPLPYYGTPIHI